MEIIGEIILAILFAIVVLLLGKVIKSIHESFKIMREWEK